MHSNLTNQQRHHLEALAEEFVERKRLGESVSIEEYVKEYPEYADDIRDLFPVACMLDRAGKKTATPTELQLVDESTDNSGEIVAGMQIGEYRLIRPIGSGGMGVVYQAEHSVLRSNVAIKLLPQSLGNRSKLRERFQREASAAARMQHPHIVQVFDFGLHESTPYYVMSLVEGWGLDRIIRRTDEDSNPTGTLQEPFDETGSIVTKWQLSKTLANGIVGVQLDDVVPGTANLSDHELFTDTDAIAKARTKLSSGSGSRNDDLWTWVARIGVQVADGLDYAHSAGVIHRDIKPSNLMIDDSNHVYITDFGLAKVSGDSSLTGTGDLLGTLRYMPPESFIGRSDHRSDIYGLGMTLYELLADEPAFSESDRGKLINAITNGNYDPLRQKVPKIPADLETIVHKAIDGDHDLRYQSAAELRDDLRRFSNGQPIHARKATFAYRASKWIVRNQIVSALAGGVSVLAIVAAAFYMISANSAAFADLQQELASEKQQSAERVTNVFDRFLRTFDASYDARESISVEELLADASDLLDTEFKNDPLVEAKLRMTVGNAYLWSSKTDLIVKGGSHLEKAIELLREHDGNRLDLARAIMGLSRARSFASEPTKENPLGMRTAFEENEKLLSEAKHIFEMQNAPTLDRVELLEVNAKVKLQRGQFDSVLSLCKEGLTMLGDSSSKEANRLRGMLIGDSAIANDLLGKKDVAEKKYREAIKLTDELNSFYARAFTYALGELQIGNKDFSGAETTFRGKLNAVPYLFSPRVTNTILMQGEWQRGIEHAIKSLPNLEATTETENQWQQLYSHVLHAQHLRLSGNDRAAISVLQDTIPRMDAIRDPDSPQHRNDFILANYYLGRIYLFSDKAFHRATALKMFETLRGSLDPLSPSSNTTIHLAYVILLSQIPEASDADIALMEKCMQKVDLWITKMKAGDGSVPANRFVMHPEYYLAKGLMEDAKGDRASAIKHLENAISLNRGRDIRIIGLRAYRSPAVPHPTLRIAEDILAKWHIENGHEDQAIEVRTRAVKSRVECAFPAPHQIRFAKARLGRLLLQLDKIDEAREVLSELEKETRNGPECFSWLEKRVAADLRKVQ